MHGIQVYHLKMISRISVLVFLASSAVTLCGGHSLGMHRKLIHDSYQCPKWLEYSLVYLGTLVGLAGPYGMVHTHDMRDWAQRQVRKISREIFLTWKANLSRLFCS